ncbi:MAG: T9SS type A sorting domain-containing protein, partial [Chitinophagaceae bacterium]|nr:T9SS type A sorting domain-containing protein [Chitinophagaceae bacterium]
NGSGTPGTTLFASNSDMQIFEGYGSPGLFSSSLYTTRTFAGTIYYTKSVTPPCTNTNRTAVLLTVNTPPQISSHPSNSTICSGSSTSFSSSGTGVGTLTYQWEASFNSGVNWSIINNGGFYSGATTSTLTVSNVTAVLDNYQYRCIVSGTCSPPATSNAATLTVNTPPTITTQPVNADGCPASTVTFTCAATGGGINYQWQEFVTSWNNITNGGMYSGATSATLTLTGITPSMDGQQYRCLITGACTPPDTTDEPTLTVNPLPTISGSSNSPVCEGNDLMLSSISTTSGVTYGWTGPGAYNSTLQNPTLSGPTTANSGNYMVTATITATGCTATASVPVVIKTTPVISSISSNAPVCSGYDINLTSASNAGTTYSWTGPLGFTSTTQNPVRSKVNLQMGGYYKLETTLNGCVSNPDSVNVTIVPSPSIGAYPTPGNKICDGDTIWFYAFASNTGTGPTYQWVKNGQDIPGENALQYTGTGLMNGDIIKLRMSPGSGISCPADILTQEMHIVAKPVLAPVVNVVMDPATPVWEGLLVTFTATPADAGKNPHYQWKRNGKDINGATSDVWSTTSLNDKDVIECEIISDYECAQPSSSMSNQVTVPVLTSVPNTAGNTNLSLFPNPNNGSFTLKGNVNKGKVQLEVLNALGQVIYKNEFSSADGNLQQDIRPGNMADGIYMLRITSGTEQANIRFRVAN